MLEDFKWIVKTIVIPFILGFVVGAILQTQCITPALAYDLPKEPTVEWTQPDYFGEYLGDFYKFTLDSTGVHIDFSNDTTFVIFNNTLFIVFLDENGEEIKKMKYGFIQEDGWLEIHTSNGVFKKLRE